MKKILISFFAILNVFCYAQFKKSENIRVQWGVANKQEEKSEFSGLFINSLGDRFTIRRYKSKIYLKKHDASGAIIQTLFFDYETEIASKSKFKTYYDRYFIVGDKVYVLTFEKDKANELFYYKVSALNTLSMQIEKPVLIHEMPFLHGESLETIKIAVSPDREKIAIGFNDLGASLDDINYGVKVFDTTFNTLWQRELKGVGRSFFKTINESGGFSLTNEGIVTLFQKVKQEGNLISMKENQLDDIKLCNKLNAFTFTEDAQVKSLISIPVNNLVEILFRMSKNGEIVAGGFYSTGFDGMNGSYLFRYNPKTGETGKIKVNEFDKELIQKMLSDREEKSMAKKELKGKEYHLPSYTLDDIVETPSGDIKFIAELYYTWQSISYDSRGNMRTVTHYVYDDILLLSYDGDGNYKWGTVIEKYQDSTDDGYWNSYNYLFDDDDVIVVFTDNPENLMQPEGSQKRYNAHGKKGVFVGVKVNEEGYADKGFLYEIRDVALFTVCGVSAKTDTTLLLHTEKGKVSKLVSFSLK